MFKKYSIDEENFLYYRPTKNDLSPIKEIFKKGGHYGNKHLIEPGMMVLDLGAHIGSFSKFCNMQGASCVCYEPDKDNFAMLKLNLDESNNLLNNSAVTTEKSPTLTFYFNENRPQDSYRFTKLPSPGYKGKITVKNTCVDELSNVSYDFLKLDIEGSEFAMIDEGRLPKGELAVIEYHMSKDKDMRHFRKRFNLLKDLYKEVTCSFASLTKPGYYPDEKYKFWIDPFIFCKGLK